MIRLALWAGKKSGGLGIVSGAVRYIPGRQASRPSPVRPSRPSLVVPSLLGLPRRKEHP